MSLGGRSLIQAQCLAWGSCALRPTLAQHQAAHLLLATPHCAGCRGRGRRGKCLQHWVQEPPWICCTFRRCITMGQLHTSSALPVPYRHVSTACRSCHARCDCAHVVATLCVVVCMHTHTMRPLHTSPGPLTLPSSTHCKPACQPFSCWLPMSAQSWARRRR